MANKNDAALNAMHEQNLDATVKIAQILIENARRVVEYQVNLAREIFEDGVNSAQEASTAADPAQAVQLRAQYAQNASQRILEATRELGEITAGTQAELAKLFGLQVATAPFAAAMQQFFKGMPGNPVEALPPFQNAFDAARGLYEQFTRASIEALNSAAAGAGRKGR